mmetsp:Transcript_70791/g.188984  ORF Transcript_70791/g.188984 Transcript_70791/m.188984 type:complete len:214 (-) Transcript_70791:989-1630(-)
MSTARPSRGCSPLRWSPWCSPLPASFSSTVSKLCSLHGPLLLSPERSTWLAFRPPWCTGPCVIPNLRPPRHRLLPLLRRVCWRARPRQLQLSRTRMRSSLPIIQCSPSSTRRKCLRRCMLRCLKVVLLVFSRKAGRTTAIGCCRLSGESGQWCWVRWQNMRGRNHARSLLCLWASITSILTNFGAPCRWTSVILSSSALIWRCNGRTATRMSK